MTKDEELQCAKVMQYWGAEDCRFSVKEIAMILIPKSIYLRYIDHLKSRGIEVARHAE